LIVAGDGNETFFRSVHSAAAAKPRDCYSASNQRPVVPASHLLHQRGSQGEPKGAGTDRNPLYVSEDSTVEEREEKRGVALVGG
jgi:hypothetical protein